MAQSRHRIPTLLAVEAGGRARPGGRRRVSRQSAGGAGWSRGERHSRGAARPSCAHAPGACKPSRARGRNGRVPQRGRRTDTGGRLLAVSGAAVTGKKPRQVLKALRRVEDQQADLCKKHEARGGQMHSARSQSLGRKEMAAKLDTLGQADVWCVARQGSCVLRPVQAGSERRNESGLIRGKSEASTRRSFWNRNPLGLNKTNTIQSCTGCGVSRQETEKWYATKKTGNPAGTKCKKCCNAKRRPDKRRPEAEKLLKRPKPVSM